MLTNTALLVEQPKRKPKAFPYRKPMRCHLEKYLRLLPKTRLAHIPFWFTNCHTSACVDHCNWSSHLYHHRTPLLAQRLDPQQSSIPNNCPFICSCPKGSSNVVVSSIRMWSKLQDQQISAWCWTENRWGKSHLHNKLSCEEPSWSPFSAQQLRLNLKAPGSAESVYIFFMKTRSRRTPTPRCTAAHNRNALNIFIDIN